MTTRNASTGARRPFVSLIPRLVFSAVIAAGLVVDAVIHLRLAADRDGIGSALTEGNVFRIEGAVALLAAVLVVALPWRRVAYSIAFIVAASAFGAVVLYRYVNVGALGPLPNMYEPIWYHDKTVSAIAEMVAAVAAAAAVARLLWSRSA